MVKPLARLVGASELMESPDADPTELAQALRGLAGINRYLGGVRVIRGQLAALLPVFPAPLRILDVGTGFADIPRALVRWARRHKCPFEVEAVDRHARILELAQRACAGYPEIRLQRADALMLPFPDGSFDVVLASLILHHMEGSEPIRFLRELDRVACRAVIVNDLRRGRWPFVVTWASLRFLSRSRLHHHDGPLSIRRAFLPEELRDLALTAGWTGPRVSRHAFFRLALVERKG
jgi:2-polyprenyl-3-methyl-5-hydroxy-6-metoxy-1,4-benzoquinol methylase